MIDLIMPVRGDSENIIYTLRSFETNYITKEKLRLVIVGDMPKNIEPDEFIEGNSFASGPQNVYNNILEGCREAQSNKVIILNDDFFLMEPTTELLMCNRGTLKAHTDHIYYNLGRISDWWINSLLLTQKVLEADGVKEPLSYELHRPFMCNPKKMVKILEKYNEPVNGTLPQWRTLYGNLVKNTSYRAYDGKASAMGVPQWGSHFCSTTRDRQENVLKVLRERFPRASQWEV